MDQNAIDGNRYEKMNEWWQAYIDGLNESLSTLEREITEAREMRDSCTDEWCTATDHYIDDLANAVYTIHEPRWTSKEQSDKLKELKRKVKDLYVDFRQAREGRA